MVMICLPSGGPFGQQEFYNCKYDPKNPEFWKQIELPNGTLGNETVEFAEVLMPGERKMVEVGHLRLPSGNLLHSC